MTSSSIAGKTASALNEFQPPQTSPTLKPLWKVAAQSRFSCLAYRTHNIGDMIQTLALTRLFPPMAAVYRHDLGSAPMDRVFVVNGFLDRDQPPRVGSECLFAGVSGPYMRHALYWEWMRQSPCPVGARDPVTLAQLSKEGIPVELAGCATLTLPLYEGPRQGIISVDFEGPGTRLTHEMSRHLTLAEQWTAASDLLSRYKTAEAVYTSRLHVALPCLAFGTPVWIARPGARGFPERFSLLEEMGIPFEELVVRDITPQRERFLLFLEKHLGQTIKPGDAKIPSLAGPDRLSLREQGRFLGEDLWHCLQFHWGREGRRLRFQRWRSVFPGPNTSEARK